MVKRLAKPAALVLLTAVLYWWFPSIDTPAEARSADGRVATWASK